MLRLAICAAVVALAAGSSAAREREAILQKIEVPDTSFEMLVATTSSDAAIFDLGETPEALVIHLIGGKLWVGFDNAEKMLETINLLGRSIASFHVERTEAEPVAVYLVPKVRALAGR